MRLPSETATHRRALTVLFATVASAMLASCWWDDNSGTAQAASSAPSPAPAPTPAPPPPTYTLGGSISGLTASGLVLANGSDTLSVDAAATGFTMPTPVAQGADYALTVRTQPAGEHCSLTNSTGTVATGNVTNVAVACAASSHTLGGTITGLPSAGLLLVNGSDTVTPPAGATAFTFATPVAEGGAYAVSVRTQPTGATCSIGSGTGTMGTSNVASVQVTCAANAYHLGGTVAGLTAGGLVLANGTDTVSPAANATSFTFAQPVSFGGQYSVTVAQQTAGLTCSVAGSFPATMGAGDVKDVVVTCATAVGYAPLAGRETCAPPFNQDGTGSAASVAANIVAIDAAGNVYASGGTSIRKITSAGVVTTLAGSDGANQPGQVDGTGSAAGFSGNVASLATDTAGNVYVGDQYMVRKVTQGGVVTTLAGQVANGFHDATGSGATFGWIRGIAVDSTGNVFVSDDNGAIRKITQAGVVTTLAGSDPHLGPTHGFVDGTGFAARFAIGPWGLVMDGAGNMYAADMANNAIRKITPAGVVTTLAGGGPSAGGWLDGNGTAAQFKLPDDLAIDAAGNLYVHDNFGSALRKVTPSGIVTTVAYDNSFTGNTGQPAPAGALHISGSLQNGTIAVNGAGVLFFPLGCAIDKTGP